MLIGHRKQWDLLRKSAESGRVSHALLFYGPEKLGKKKISLELVKLLGCEKGLLNGPCQKCSFCLQIEKRIHPDLIFIEPEGKEIKISQIRELGWKLSLKPYLAPFKAAILDQAHLMNQEAQTCLLKTLEEPRGESLLILVTEYPQAFFPTILSRVQKIRFYPVAKSKIIDYLSKSNISIKKAKEIADFSQGRPGEVIEFLSSPQKLEARKELIGDFIKISNSDLSSRFQYIKNLNEEPQILKEILETWLSFLRNNLISRLNERKEKVLPVPYPPVFPSAARAARAIKFIENTNFLISTTNINPRLALEVLMMEI